LRLGAAVDAAKAEAHYHNGWLTVRMPKVGQRKPTHIQVRLSRGDMVPPPAVKEG